MTKFERFAEFIIEGLIYPLIVAFISTLIPLGLWFIWNIEVMWLVYLAYAIYCVVGVWLVLFVISMIGNKIIEWREDIKFHEKMKRCRTCDCFGDLEFAEDCYECKNGSNYRHILIEKDESEE